MIHSIEMKCFRQHTDLQVNFTRGLNVIRGPNESGKTTITEAMLYALYGSSSLRDSLPDVVTWGHKDNELKVKLVIEISGTVYTFTRGKSGAECNWADQKVTGQKEVTKFAADLLGADEKTATMLMLASQDGLRGALENGPAKVSELIGGLADFDLIDRVLDTSQKELQLGSEEPLKRKIVDLSAELQTLQEAAPDPAAIETARTAVSAAQASLQALEHEADQVLQPALARASEALDTATAGNESHQRAKQALEALRTRKVDEAAKLAAAVAVVASRPAADAAAPLRAQLEAAGRHAEIAQAYADFRRLPAYPEAFWEGTVETLQAEIAAEDAKVSNAREAIAAASAEIRALGQNILTVGNCPTCGQSVNGDAHVAEKNAELQKRIAELTVEHDGHRVKLTEAQEMAAALRGLMSTARPFVNAATALAAYVKVDASVYPPRLSWAGEVPGPAADTAPIQRQIRQIEQAINDAVQAEGRAEVHRAAIAELDNQVQTTERVLATLPLVDLAPLQAAQDAAFTAYSGQRSKVNEQREVVSSTVQMLGILELTAATHGERVLAAEKRLAELREEIETLNYNNEFVKRVKSLKPVITDHLWNTVLSAVSTFFSQMRGQQSVVTKDAKGFQVNGRSSALSGSTLDALALAIRSALTKTFLPNTSFMTLDEPAHGCDDTRTGSVLGFLAGSGMAQIILASHDDLSESVADNVVMLGA